jgi:hypothetical protein
MQKARIYPGLFLFVVTAFASYRFVALVVNASYRILCGYCFSFASFAVQA